jgi:hypothetical protein
MAASLVGAGIEIQGLCNEQRASYAEIIALHTRIAPFRKKGICSRNVFRIDTTELTTLRKELLTGRTRNNRCDFLPKDRAGQYKYCLWVPVDRLKVEKSAQASTFDYSRTRRPLTLSASQD